MERESWIEVSAAIGQVQRRFAENRRYIHRTATIARVYLWAVRNDRPICWACDADQWEKRCCPLTLPDQSTMSRRTRSKSFERFMTAVGKRLAGKPATSRVKSLDGKALAVAAPSKDRDARWGRGAGQLSNGYKLHLIRAGRPMPEQWAVTPLNVDERVMGRRLAKRLNHHHHWGYLLCDSMYDDNELHEIAARSGIICWRHGASRARGWVIARTARIASAASTCWSRPPASTTLACACTVSAGRSNATWGTSSATAAA
jgi:hypothetical protein